MEKRSIGRKNIIKEYDIRLSNEKIGLGVRQENLIFHKGNENNYIKLLVSDLNRVFHLEDLLTEESYCIAYNDCYSPIGIMQMAHGNEDTSPGAPFYAILFLKLLRAKYYVMVHNHPKIIGMKSNEFSPADEVVRLKTEMIGENCGMEMLANIIIYKGGYKVWTEDSMNTEGKLRFLVELAKVNYQTLMEGGGDE